MKRRLFVEVNCGEKTCGGCRWDDHGSLWCELFGTGRGERLLKGSRTATRHLRCLSAERKATREEGK